MTELNDRLLAAYAHFSESYKRLHGLLGDVQTECRRSMNPGVVVDSVYALKKLSQFADAMRKDTNKALDVLQKIGCVLAMQTEDNSLVGELATGYGDSSQQLLLPDREKQPNEYAALMRAVGVPSEAAANPALKLSFSGCAEYASRLASEGKPLPKGLEHARTIPKFTIIARPRKDVEELAMRLHGPNGTGSAIRAEDIPF